MTEENEPPIPTPRPPTPLEGYTEVERLNFCGWCGHPKCTESGEQYPHHRLCCADRRPTDCPAYKPPSPDQPNPIQEKY